MSAADSIKLAPIECVPYAGYEGKNWALAPVGTRKIEMLTNVCPYMAKKAERDKPLVSTGFGSCVGLLIKNIPSGDTALMHINRIAGTPHNPPFKLDPEQKKMLAEFSVKDGKNIILLIKGENVMSGFEHVVKAVEKSIPNAVITTLHIEDTKIPPPPPQSRTDYWGMAYTTENDELRIEVPPYREVRIFKPFT